MSLEIKTGYMTAAQIEELEKNKKNQIGGATNMTVSQVSGSPMPGLNIDTAIANSGKDIKVESPLQKPAITPYKETQNLSGFMASQPKQGTTTAVTDTGLKSFLEAERVRKKNFLKQTIKIASMNQPDRAAEIQRLSTEFNIPPSIVQDNLDQMKNQSKLMEIDFDTLEVDSPILADQLRNLSFASVAHDDLESLGAIEKAFKWFKEGVLEAPENMASGWKAGNSIYDLGILGTEIRDSGGDITPELQTQIDQLHEIMASNSGEGIAHSAAQIAGTMYEGTRDAFIESGAQSLAVAGGTYIATLPFQGPFAFTPGPEDVIAGAGAAATGTMAFVPSMTVNMMRNSYEIEGGISYIDLREMGATHENASNVSNVVGMVNASLEMVGITAVTKPWRKLWSGFVNKKINQSITRGGLAKDFFASYLLGIGVETFTEGTQEFVNILGEEFTKMIDEGVDVESLFATEEGMEELWGRLNEVMVTTAQGMVLLSLPGATTTYAAGHSQVSNAEKTTQLFEALSDGAANSTLIERLPSEGQKFVKEVLKESDANTVYIDHEKFNDYLNKRGIDPNSEEAKEFFQDLGIDGQLEELAVTGGDVAIPIEKYTTNIAPTDHHPDLAPHIRVNQEHWSASESENWLKNNPDFKSNVEAIQKEADRVSNLTDIERENNVVYKEVFDQLVSQGTSREDSNAQAVMYSAVFEVLGKEGNVNPGELFQKYGLNIQRVFDGQRIVEPKNIESLAAEVKEAKKPKIKPTAEFETLPTLSSKNKKGVIDGENIALEAQMMGTKNQGSNKRGIVGDSLGGFTIESYAEIKKEDYKNTTINVDELIKNNKDLKEAIYSDSGVREFLGEDFTMNPIISSKGKILDGENRIAQLVKDGVTEINVLEGVPLKKKRKSKDFPKRPYVPYPEGFSVDRDAVLAALPDNLKTLTIDSTIKVGNRFFKVGPSSMREDMNMVPMRRDFKAEGIEYDENVESLQITFQDLDLLNAQHALERGQEFRVINDQIIIKEIRAAASISGDFSIEGMAPFFSKENVQAILKQDKLTQYYDIVEIDAPVNKNGIPLVRKQNSKNFLDKAKDGKGYIAIAKWAKDAPTTETSIDNVNTELNTAQREDIESAQYDMPTMIDFLENTLNINIEDLSEAEIAEQIQAQVYDPQGRILDQAAFHGTGLTEFFEQFSTDFIGTGENGTAFGWGLYFASQRSVAEWYRDKLSRKMGGEKVTVTKADGTVIEDISSYSPEAYESWWMEGRDIEGAIDRAANQLASARAMQAQFMPFIEDIDMLDDGILPEGFRFSKKANASNNIMTLQWIPPVNRRSNKFKLTRLTNPKEALWENLLVASGNTPKEVIDQVKEKIQTFIDIEEIDGGRVSTLEARYNLLAEFSESTWVTEPNKPGSIYKVELAPAEEDYLIWDYNIKAQSDKVQKIIKKLRKSHGLGNVRNMYSGQEVYQQMMYSIGSSSFKEKEEASLQLLENGIRGIKFADGNTRQNLGGEGRVDWNYVIFDAADVEITQTFNQEAIEPSEPELTLEEFIDAKQYQGTHRAPTSSYGAPGHDLTDGMYPDDVYGPNGNRYYGDNSAAGEQAMAHMHAMRGKPDYEITVYRAAPKDAKTINPGDWVTTVKSYADEHGFRQYDEGEYTVLSQKVKAKEIYTEGNSLFEWGYDPTERQSEFFQSVPIMDGREKLRKYGLDERKRNRNAEVALALQSRTRKKYGKIESWDYSKEAENKIASWIAAEVRYKARQTDDPNSAVGWYSKKFQTALDTLGKKYPEMISESGFNNDSLPGVQALENKQNARDFFTLIVAFTSDGQKVKENFSLAADLYSKFRKTGLLPESGKFGGERNVSMIANAKRINQMVSEKGFQGTRDFLLQEQKVKELKAIAAAEGLKFESEFDVDMTLPMAAVVVGAKLGSFYANLMGLDSVVTMDRWFSRTINRMRGDLLMKPTQKGLIRFRGLINQPNLTDEETILATIEPTRAYKNSGFKDKSVINKAANTIHKMAFGGLVDSPRNKGDRRFMQNAVTNARKKLKKSGITLTEADIQAVLWYYEKQMYGELGAVASTQISFEEAADILVNNKKVAPGINVEGPGGQQTEVFDQDKGTKRGSIQFRNVGKRDQKTIISLFEAADNSTFIHESGHFFLQVMQDVAESAEASEQIKTDWQATLDYLGVKSGEDIGVKEHEKWAESFEKYLYEGKAPTIEMEGPFRKFKAWLQSVYKQATGLDIEINDEIRGVFDRLFGTTDEIRLAQEQNEMMALFESPDVMGMDNNQWLEYQEVVRKAAQEAEDDLDQKKLAEVTRQNSKAYQREIKAMEEEVTKEAEAMPIYRVIHFLQTGEDINTKAPLDGMPAIKMHTQSLRDTFGPDILSKLPRRRKMHASDGTHHNEIAEMFGFESGLDMITQMQTAQPIKQFIKSQAAERVARDSGALSMNPQKLTEEAVKSIAGSKARGRLLKMQMDMTARKAKIPGTPINVLQEMARQIVANKTISNIHIKQARLAENRAYKAAQKAILEENWFEAHKQMQSQTLNYYVYREAEAAMDDVNKKLRYLDRISKPKHAKKLDRDAIDAIYSLLDKVDLRRTRGTRKQTYSAWVQAQQAEGIDVPNAEEMQALLENPDKTHFKDMTYAKFVEFADSVKSIESIARYKQNILDENEKIEFASLVDELVNTARTEYANKIDKNTDTWVAETPDFRDTKVKSLLQFKGDFLAAHDKMEFVFEAMDGDKTNGVWWRTFFKRLSDAEDAETVMNEQYITALTEIIESKYTLTERKNWQNTVNTRKGRFNKENIISIALNWGNLENQKAVLDGFAGQEQAWDITEADVVTMLNQHMEAKDWQMIQEVWDLIDQLWPEISALQKKVTGLVPPKVEAAPFKTRFGTLKGGYYPLYYSREFTKKERFRYESTLGDELYDKNSWVVAATRKGHTMARTDSAGQLVRMDLKVLSEHMSNVIHDLTHREAVFYMNRLIKNESIQGAVKGVMGKEVYNKIYPWIRRIANPKPPSYYFVDQVVNYGNTSATMVAMGFKVTTALVQPFGYSQSVAYLGKGWAWQGLMSFYSNPFENKEAIFARSPMMRTRTKSLDRDIREAISDITARDSRLKKIQSKYFYFIGMMDMWVSLPTWQGAYEKAIHEGLSEKDAIAQGDSAVRMTQSSGAVKDLADIQGREDVFYKTFTKFYSYFSAYWNMTRRTKRLSKQGKITKVQAFEQFVWLTVLPATLAEALLGRGPSRDDDDDNDNLTGWSSWALINALTFKFNGMVGVRDLVNAVKHPEFGVQSPWQDLFEMTSKAKGNAIDILAGEGNANDWKGLLLGISYAAKLPGRQISNMYEHLVEVFQDGEDFSFYEFMVSINRND